ncbi:hypothetical protein H6F90_08915 [Trichocoleus sp. FACHB-591]|uniref:alr0857 family protein n=1 Tax=Trichocoleus sp. FACHB-591 TaxID=2692872 RepID=UPI00168A2F43|nr:alr0857 family protein [Trichocoleus sp. FACHB-591]MBD2095278.1 hypothetical protein [Trichocoleus sp. FACHB-591]
MLKLTYTDMGLHLERLAQSPEELVARRAILALRMSQNLHLEPSRAAFLLPADLPELSTLEAAIRREGNAIALCSVCDDYVEVSLRGMWIAPEVDAHEGVFVAVMSDRLEFLLHKLWQVSQTQVSFLL